jgi:hypothetical protein
MSQPLLFGMTAETITAWSTLGSFIVVLIFSAVAAIMQAQQGNPPPVVMADLVSRESDNQATYKISVCNIRKSPIQVSRIEAEHEDPGLTVSGDGVTFAHSVAIDPKPVMPNQVLSLDVTFRRTKAHAKNFYVYVTWHGNGTAGGSNTTPLFIQ